MDGNAGGRKNGSSESKGNTFTASDRVLEAVGVDNVCERAAAAAAGPGSEMIVPKTAYNGMTLAVSKRIH